MSEATKRVDRGSRLIGASAADVYAAMIEPEQLEAWLPPDGMLGTLERFDPWPGGGYRMVLTYVDATTSPGKSSASTDVPEAEFVEIVPEERIVQRVVFASDDPRFAGTMTMTWRLEPEGDGTLVTIEATDVPPGISPADHATGIASSLANLAHHLATPDPA